ncbi:hypothetical protein B0E53_02553 [Micromonospora sp. MH33]|nr:hypothetical protein B0E53_02553 [Micromonospora sp. MH33]
MPPVRRWTCWPTNSTPPPAALSGRHAEAARRARDRLRQNKDELQALSEAVEGAREATTLSPLHWHRRRSPLNQYARAAEPIDRSMRNSGTLIRRSVTLIEDDEHVPSAMPRAVRALAEAVRALRHEFAAGTEPQAAREQALRAVCEAGQASRDGVGFFGSVVVAQLRTTVSDLLATSGLTRTTATGSSAAPSATSGLPHRSRTKPAHHDERPDPERHPTSR